MADVGIILAFSKEEVISRLIKMLGAGGIRVSGVCRSAAEAARLTEDMERALVITGFKLPDMTAEELLSELPRGTGMLVVGKRQQREMIGSDDIIFVPLPVNKDELCRAAVMALGEYGFRRKRQPRPVRSEEEKRTIAQAKRFLMEAYMMSEMQAHRFIQKQSMDNGLKFIDTARRILTQDD